MRTFPFCFASSSFEYRYHQKNPPVTSAVKMSGGPHLTKGSSKPPASTPDTLRLYSMKFCPFAQRARLVLLAKSVPHEIVNINTIVKPEWYTEVHPEGKVPALDTGDRIIVESLNIVDYLDKTFPEPPLYRDEKLRAADDNAVSKIDPLGALFFRCVFKDEDLSLAEWSKEFASHLDFFEAELKKRGSLYYGGTAPGMMDYMLWPWAERAGVVPLKLGQKLPLNKDDYETLTRWYRAMRENPIVNSIYMSSERHYKTVLFGTKGVEPNYDAV